MNYKQVLKEYVIVTISTLIIAIAFNVFFLPFNMVTGGSSGVAVIFNYLLKINPSITVLIMHVTVLILGYIFLGKEKIVKSLYGSLVYPLFIQLTIPIRDYIISLNIDNKDLLVFIIFGAVITGLASGTIYKLGYTTGGSDIINHIIHKYFGLTIGTANFVVNVIIVISGGVAIGFEKILYAVLILYIRGISTDKILIGNYSNKIFYIVTQEQELVKDFIFYDLGLKVTEINSIGGYSNNGSKILMCVVSNRDYFILKEGISELDSTAFFLVTHAHS
jgi:uncharacterized membrane-anchored protein YitT (DUF2179 family)